MRDLKTEARRRRPMAVAAAALALALAGCTQGSSNSASQQPSNEQQTIVFATQGLGSEGDATKAAVDAFEKANPNIHVQILTLSPDANNAQQQLTQRFVAGDTTPDVITADVIWPATFARAGWLASLDGFSPDLGSFFPGQVPAGQYNGQTYAVPWFINAEGLYYRTDLVPKAPTTPTQLVSDAKQAMAKDPSIREGLAFEGDKYEGLVTSYMGFEGAFGGTLDPTNLATPQNVSALQFMRDTIAKYGIAPQAVTGWEEPDVERAFLSGQAVFATNWPYVLAEAEANGSAVKGKTGWIPFPSETGRPQAALGGDMLAINAKSAHLAAAWTFIQYLTSPQAQIQRALTAGDPPAVQSAYGPQLFGKAPYFKDEKTVFAAAAPRPVTPNYPKISEELQTALSSAITGQTPPSDALNQAQSQIASIS